MSIVRTLREGGGRDVGEDSLGGPGRIDEDDGGAGRSEEIGSRRSVLGRSWLPGSCRLSE
ncbi:hypothetical protein BE17_17470 [Sorangium cellulosum]|uniref:Uncharacterized protein n=1 Tax=Sorangium cellulosum TaxID=56 RepID=A0A150RCB4_SORCE|nr:hypothetical protein BE17_17470 [Sorangium cellulosum]